MSLESDVLNLQFSVARLQSLLEITMKRCADAGILLTQADVERATQEALAFVQKAHPDRAIGLAGLDLGQLDS